MRIRALIWFAVLLISGAAAALPGLPAVVTIAVPRGSQGQLGPSTCPFLNLTLSTLIPVNIATPIVTSCITETLDSGPISSITNFTVSQASF